VSRKQLGAAGLADRGNGWMLNPSLNRNGTEKLRNDVERISKMLSGLIRGAERRKT
jgi:hypothetical protein